MAVSEARGLEIYFAGAVRSGGATIERLRSRIDALSWFGHVLTEHMAFPETIDAGHRDDTAIHAHDQALLARAHVFIADATVPSTGTGYMAARACARGIPVLCLYEAGTAPSAMIAGSPEIATRRYADDADFVRQVRAFLVEAAPHIAAATRCPRVFLAGKPGCGKGTLGQRLSELTGAPHISTGELVRAIMRQPAHPLAERLGSYVHSGRLVPAELMRDIVAARLGQPDCRMLGCILDGYPPSRADLENLTALGIAPDVVLFLDCSDETSIRRQVARAERPTDLEERATTRLATFHAAGIDLPALAREWYPGRLVVRLDAERPAEDVLATALAVLRDGFGGAHHERSYFAVPAAHPVEVRSTRLHFHIDGPDVHHVRAAARELHVRHPQAQGQVKIYPIRGLALGPQHARMPIYPQLPNFHLIPYPSRTEAFITGRLGDGDRALMQAVLEITRARGGMAELEEYLGEWTLTEDGEVRADAVYPELAGDHAYPEFDAQRCRDIPRWELHHGFDLPRSGDAPPLSLPELVELCAPELENGGWFLFANDRHWAYRSNEFSTLAHDAAMARLAAQARTLQALLARRSHRAAIGYSLEIVHGIWVFN